MIIEVSAEPYTSGIRRYDEYQPLTQEDTTISDATWRMLQDWYQRYEKYVPMTLKELEPHWDVIRNLDTEGKEITKKISDEWFPDAVQTIRYFSVCQDKLLMTLRK